MKIVQKKRKSLISQTGIKEIIIRFHYLMNTMIVIYQIL